MSEHSADLSRTHWRCSGQSAQHANILQCSNIQLVTTKFNKMLKEMIILTLICIIYIFDKFLLKIC